MLRSDEAGCRVEHKVMLRATNSLVFNKLIHYNENKYNKSLPSGPVEIPRNDTNQEKLF